VTEPSGYGHVEPLEARHRRRLDCGSPAQTLWFRRHALRAQVQGTTRVYVVTVLDDDVVVGFYALSSGSVERSSVPDADEEQLPRYPIPVVLLTRLGVEVREQSRGLGRALLKDALLRVDRAADIIGAHSLLIHCETPRAREWYLKQADFRASPTHELHLLLRLTDLRKALNT
jgi:GNAT superfamily N-acetyltransferase